MPIASFSLHKLSAIRSDCALKVTALLLASSGFGALDVLQAANSHPAEIQKSFGKYILIDNVHRDYNLYFVGNEYVTPLISSVRLE